MFASALKKEKHFFTSYVIRRENLLALCLDTVCLFFWYGTVSLSVLWQSLFSKLVSDTSIFFLYHCLKATKRNVLLTREKLLVLCSDEYICFWCGLVSVCITHVLVFC